jgi:hypothetical protein
MAYRSCPYRSLALVLVLVTSVAAAGGGCASRPSSTKTGDGGGETGGAGGSTGGIGGGSGTGGAAGFGGFGGLGGISGAGGRDGGATAGAGGSTADASDAPLPSDGGALPDGGPGGSDAAGSGGAGGAGGTGGTTTDAAGPTPDVTPACFAVGATCGLDSHCCSRICDATTKTCKSNITRCGQVGDACVVGTDCCNVACVNGHCGTTACTADNQPCQSGTQCCSGACTGGNCQPLNATCKTAGNPCGAAGGNSECCSKLCQNGKCALAASYCIQPGDVCHRSTDCCTGLCSIATGAAAGTCKEIATSGAGSCVQDGIVCSGCNNCCSRVCAPFALSGVNICQPASGCRLTNDLCEKASDCCGGDVAPSGGAKVTCNIDPATNPPLGACANPNGCQPRGGLCGLHAGTNQCGNAREDCCDCESPKWRCCKPDLLGIPRCHGGSTTLCPNGYDSTDPKCCVAAGGQCKFSSECCGGSPCVPDASGVLRCLAPATDGGVACVAASGVCTTTADCCTGLTCNIVPGDPAGKCGEPPPPPPPPPAPDASVPPDSAPPEDGAAPVDATVPPPDLAEPDTAPVCALYGQACSASIPCCAGDICNEPGGTGNPCNGQTGCSCYRVIR